MLKRLAVVWFLLVNACGDSPSAEVPVEVPDRTEPGSSTKETKSTTAPDDEAVSVPAASEVFAEAFPASEPGAWTWLGPEEFDNVPRCMDGSVTGLGLSRSPTGSKKTLIFMQGGGACFDAQTCAIADKALAADHMDEETFKAWKDANGATTVMNRARAENPFKDWNYVFVPYCSGDVFSGANESGFDGRPQVGFENVAAYLPRIQSTFRDAEQVVLAGTSAGGYGAAYNYVQVQKAFPKLDITVIDDSGPPFTSTFTATCLQEKWKTTWLMDQTSPVAGPFPLGLDPQTGKDGGGLFALIQEVIKEHPKSKFAFLSHEGDLVMRYFHGIGFSLGCRLPGLLSGDFFADGLREVRTMQGDNWLTYYGPGTGHQYFKTDDADLYDTEVEGTKLTTWLADLVNGREPARRIPARF